MKSKQLWHFTIMTIISVINNNWNNCWNFTILILKYCLNLLSSRNKYSNSVENSPFAFLVKFILWTQNLFLLFRTSYSSFSASWHKSAKETTRSILNHLTFAATRRAAPCRMPWRISDVYATRRTAPHRCEPALSLNKLRLWQGGSRKANNNYSDYGPT